MSFYKSLIRVFTQRFSAVHQGPCIVNEPSHPGARCVQGPFHFLFWFTYSMRAHQIIMNKHIILKKTDTHGVRVASDVKNET